MPSELFTARVPGLILQPLVENAVKHGIERKKRGGALRIAACRINGMLTLSVYNDGPQLPPDWRLTGSGIGIANARARLRGLYGDASQLTLRNCDAGVEACVSLPFHQE